MKRRQQPADSSNAAVREIEEFGYRESEVTVPVPADANAHRAEMLAREIESAKIFAPPDDVM